MYGWLQSKSYDYREAGNMERYNFQEYADMLMAYGAANGNSLEASRIYAARFPQRQRHPCHRTFAGIHRRLRETGSVRTRMQDAGRPRVITPDEEETVLDAVGNSPRISTRAVAHNLGLSQSQVWRTLHRQQLYPFHFQRVQALNPTDFPRRREYCHLFLNNVTQNDSFLKSVLFTDECSFSRDGMFNTHNLHYWADENPHVTWPHAYQQRFSVNIWCGVLGNHLLGPHVFEGTLTGVKYLEFLQHHLSVYLDDIPLGIRRQMWLMHDGAPAHSSLRVREYLNNKFPGRWIGPGGSILWPARSPDLNPADFFLWGHLKSLVYQTPVANDHDLMQRILDGCTNIRETPGLLERVQGSLIRRYNVCIEAHGGHIEHLL